MVIKVISCLKSLTNCLFDARGIRYEGVRKKIILARASISIEIVPSIKANKRAHH